MYMIFFPVKMLNSDLNCMDVIFEWFLATFFCEADHIWAFEH